MPKCFYSFSLRAVIFTLLISKHISISTRWINQISPWGPVSRSSPTGFSRIQGALHQLIDKPTAGLHFAQVDQQPEACTLERTQGTGSPPNHSQVTSCFWNPISQRHFSHFLLLQQLTCTAVKKKKSIQWEDIKSQQDKNLVAAIQSKMLPPAHLLVLSLLSLL